jgi:hypothetical protein
MDAARKERTMNMNEFSDKEYTQLTALLEQTQTQILCYSELTRKQLEILESDDADALLKNLEERQTVINGINRLQQKASLLLQLYDHYKTLAAAHDRKVQRVDGLLDQARDALRAIQINDAKNLEKAKQNRDRYGAEVKRLSKSKKSIKLYNQTDFLSGPVFFDNKK